MPTTNRQDWRLPGTTPDRQTMALNWSPVDRSEIDGVFAREVRHVPKINGYLTEVFRQDWGVGAGHVDQIFQVHLQPGAISAWHAHGEATDRLFGIVGNVKLVLFDARPESPTHGALAEYWLGTLRPTLVIVPPGVWHGLYNPGHEPAFILNAVDQAYCYEKPDHWRLPPDTSEIPYRFR